MVPVAFPHKAYNTLPAIFRGLDAIEPIAILRLFLTDSLLKTITDNTNEYASQKLAEEKRSGGRQWKEVVLEDISCWLGIVLYMGVHSSPSVADYWKHDGLNPAHPIAQFMSQTRFEQIKQYFHVSSPKLELVTPTGRRLWHAKVDPVLEQLRKSSKAYRMPSTNVAVDEAMIRCTGRSQDTYKMPSKSIEQGFKFHCLADHGYVWDFLPTSNQAGPNPVPSIEGITPTGEIVYHLLGQLPQPMYWVAYLDNF